jgi:L-threonylcarbamoyladenylate synthase
LPFTPGSPRLHAAVQALAQNGVIACPTEAVWGLGCDPWNELAVERLLALKNRPVHKGLIMVAANLQQLDFLLSEITPQQHEALSASWPGPATWLLPHGGRVPRWICGEHDTVAVRVSDHPVVSALCLAWGGPLVSTSANPAGARPAREAFQVRRYFGRQVDCLLPGRVGALQRPTVIRDLISGQIVRD